MDVSPLHHRSTGVTDRDLCDGSPSGSLEQQPIPGNFYARIAEQMDSHGTGVVNHDSYPTAMPFGDSIPTLGDTNFGSNEAADFSTFNTDAGNPNADVEHLLIDPDLLPVHFDQDGTIHSNEEPPSIGFLGADNPIHPQEQNGYMPQPVTTAQDSSALFTGGEHPSIGFLGADNPIHTHEQNGNIPQSSTATQDYSALLTGGEPSSIGFLGVGNPIHTHEQDGNMPQSVTTTRDSSALFTYPPPVNPGPANMFGAATTVPGQQDMLYSGPPGRIGISNTQSRPPNVQSTAANHQSALDHVIHSDPTPNDNQTAATRLPPFTGGRVLVVQWENFVSTAERLMATVRHSMETLKMQVNQSLTVHEECIVHYTETRNQRWGAYIEELQFHYSLIRDHQCASLRAALHNLQQWLKQYGRYLPQDNVRRGIGVMHQYAPLRRDIDNFRLPIWESMAVERMVRNMGNNGNAI